MRKVLLACVVAAVGLGGAWADDTPGEEAVREAITVLEARKAQVEKKEDKDKIAKAIADLEKLLPAAKNDGGKAKADADLVKLITPAALKKKFAGKAAFNAKTGELTLVYDFKEKEQLKDFDLGDAKPEVKQLTLRVGPADGIQHVAKFKTMKVTGSVAVENVPFDVRKPFMRTTEGTSVAIDEWNGNRLKLLQKETQIGEKHFGRVSFEKRLVPVVLLITESKASAKFGDHEIAGKVEGVTAGHVELLGGQGGVMFKSLVISGVPDEGWAKTFFKE
ncbi:hypothetical protein [Limnoglobus roseus]|uniref:Uncharacterized protein n=1 Tax=Limnoglobus roseus TaxID=2598579 RepID=A0A5C1AI70_9BACT|nr:hypothetical protein [Limnoglobus roseus]QEL17867.1 hypothetical protein PX52LOC_04878 [Limnoglobus roseus]